MELGSFKKIAPGITVDQYFSFMTAVFGFWFVLFSLKKQFKTNFWSGVKMKNENLQDLVEMLLFISLKLNCGHFIIHQVQAENCIK